MSRLVVRLVFVTGALLCAGSFAHAQSRSRPLFRGGAIEVDVGGAWAMKVPLGSASAPLTGNQGAPVVNLFDTSTEIDAYPAFEAHLGVHVTRVFEIEGGFRYARPEIRTQISDDFEDAPDVTAIEQYSQYAIELNGVLHLNTLRFGDTVPFIFGGGGYLRELHDGRELVDSGELYQAGGGFKALLARSPRGLIRGVGLRLDARVQARRRGIELDEDEPLRTYAAAGAALVILF